ncbi:Importin-11-like protein [Drosera capensis]
MMKVLVAFQARHPYSFSDEGVLPPILDFCINKIINPEAGIISYEHFCIQCMIMVKSVLECKEYQRSLTGHVVDETAITLEQAKKNISAAVSALLASLFPNDRVILLCNILIRRYFVLSANDIEEWKHNPEAFHHEQDMVQWTERLRPCAEALYIVLFEKYSKTCNSSSMAEFMVPLKVVMHTISGTLLGPVVVSILQESMSNCPITLNEITPGLLLKDAAYGATAYVYYELSNYLSFKEWFNNDLSLELTNDYPSRCIIKRKVALILGQWVSEEKVWDFEICYYCHGECLPLNGDEMQIDAETKQQVYSASIRLLEDRDVAVRLAACRTLCSLVEDSTFSDKDFIPLLPRCWNSCFGLFNEVVEFDSKVQVLNLISVLIGHAGQIVPYTEKLVEFFQKVWEDLSSDSILQIQILVALRSFVISLGYHSPVCYNMLLPILRRGINVNGPDELNLLEDSLLLWETTLSYAPSLAPQLSDYFPYLAEIIERSFDHLKIVIEIIDNYIVLGGAEFLSRHASIVAKMLDMIVGNVNDTGLLSILQVIELLVQCYPKEVPPLITSTLQKLVVLSLSGGEDLDPSKTCIKASSAVILARILVLNTNYLAELTSEESVLLLLRNTGIQVKDNVLLCLADVWLDKVDNMTSIQRRTIGFALSIILTLRLPQVLNMLDQILSVCTSVILGGSDCQSDGESRAQTDGTIPSIELRKRQIKLADPIRQMSLENSVRENLQTCAALHGEPFNLAIGRMHPTAFAQTKQALNL